MDLTACVFTSIKPPNSCGGLWIEGVDEFKGALIQLELTLTWMSGVNSILKRGKRGTHVVGE